MLLVLPGKAYDGPSDYWLTAQKSEPVQEKLSMSNYPNHYENLPMHHTENFFSKKEMKISSENV